jgi:hypothetical protein
MTKETLSPELVRTVTRFAKTLRLKHAPIDRRTADLLARLLRSALVPRRKPGRKPTPRVLTALRMHEQKIPWKEVYLAIIHGYATLHPCERILLARTSAVPLPHWSREGEPAETDKGSPVPVSPKKSSPGRPA